MSFRGGSSASNMHHIPSPPPSTVDHAISEAFRTNQPLSAGTFPCSVCSIRASSVMSRRMLVPCCRARGLGAEPVADAPHGANEARLARVLAELLSQLRHVHVDHVVV